MAHLLKNVEAFVKHHGLTVCAGFIPRNGILADERGVAIYDYEVCPRGVYVTVQLIATGEIIERLPSKNLGRTS